jgi:hypothetical protein
MGIDEWAVLAAVVFTGLWSGLFCMLNLVIHPMLRAMDDAGFSEFMHGFLPTARGAPFNYVAVIGMVVSPVVALIAMDSSESAFPLTAIGLAVTVAGPLLASNRLAEPNYDVILAWKPGTADAEFKAARSRYFTLNWIRAAATWTAFALFLAALLELV